MRGSGSSCAVAGVRSADADAVPRGSGVWVGPAARSGGCRTPTGARVAAGARAENVMRAGVVDARPTGRCAKGGPAASVLIEGSGNGVPRPPPEILRRSPGLGAGDAYVRAPEALPVPRACGRAFRRSEPPSPVRGRVSGRAAWRGTNAGECVARVVAEHCCSGGWAGRKNGTTGDVGFAIIDAGGSCGLGAAVAHVEVPVAGPDVGDVDELEGPGAHDKRPAKVTGAGAGKTASGADTHTG
jgi:hypothetical protein